jgi:L(+)-tartrate dehydratase beta subunit
MSELHLKTPLADNEIAQLDIGDIVYFSGEGWTCRSKLQKAVFEDGWRLPFSIQERNLLIHVGPVVVKEKHEWRLAAFNPTSSIRFEKWGPRAIKEWGLKAIVGKTTMGLNTQHAMKESHCIHAAPVGIASNLYLQQMRVKEVFGFEEFGSIEAAWILELKDFGPFLVDIDARGRNYFDRWDAAVADAKKKVYAELGIPQDFSYTKLH